jgi:hypothetical protein
MTDDIYKKLSAKLPQEAIQHAPKSVTRKSYDMTGYKVQYVVDRLNGVLGIEGWSLGYSVVKEQQGVWGNGKPWWDVAVDIKMTIGSAFRSSAGGHRADTYGDAIKGALTDGIKKTAALFSVGGDAYKGEVYKDPEYREPQHDQQQAQGQSRRTPTRPGPHKANR